MAGSLAEAECCAFTGSIRRSIWTLNFQTRTYAPLTNDVGKRGSDAGLFIDRVRGVKV